MLLLYHSFTSRSIDTKSVPERGLIVFESFNLEHLDADLADAALHPDG